MREILFRGKNRYENKWVYGAYSLWDYDSETKTTTTDTSIIDYNDECLWVRVIPETVGQFTGMTDVNDEKIFEGDIVKFKRVNALGYTTSRVGVVEYYDELPIFYIYANTGDAWDWVDCEEIEVIGNIHDNLELMEAKW